MNQFNRIADNSLVQDQRRVSAARIAAFRYYDNIRRRVGNWNYSDGRLYDRQFPRNTYMGLTNG